MYLSSSGYLFGAEVARQRVGAGRESPPAGGSRGAGGEGQPAGGPGRAGGGATPSLTCFNVSPSFIAMQQRCLKEYSATCYLSIYLGSVKAA